MSNLPVSLGLLCGGFFFLITFGIGLALILININSKKKAGISQSWPSVSGTVTLSEVRQSVSTDDDGNTSVSYYPYVEYTYSVSGQILTSKQIAFGGMKGYGSPNLAEPTLKKYPLQAAVIVYYNPQKPSEAVLERSIGSGGKTAKTMGILLLIISGIIACPLLIGIIRNFF